MNDKLQNAKKILSYWQTTSFLKQKNFPKPNEPKARKSDEDQIKIEFSCALDKASNAVSLDEVFREINKCCMDYKKQFSWENEKSTCIGRITFEFGKVRRQCCIDRINEFYKYEPVVEENYQNIAYFGFQLSNDGEYVNNSLSISPIIWAIHALNNKKTINKDNYTKDIKEHEIICFDEDRIFEESDSAQLSEMKELGYDAQITITPKLMKSINNEMFNEYVKPIIKNKNKQKKDYRQYCLVSFTMYKNKDVYLKAEEQNYSLSMDFFSEDIEMVKEALKDKEDFLCSYICSETKENDGKFDVLNDSEKMKNKIAELTDLRNAPIGKWPSQYNLVFMQQLAVNIESSQKLSNQPIFSVNGPPGTGKTTLLKEIIADNIIRRAKILSEYDTPDALFKKNEFLRDTNTTNQCSYWYSLTNEEVNKYSVLIASSNNKAVENISKEFPKLKEIISITDNEITWIPKDKYKEISDLFNPKENLKNNEEKRDIYFNSFADEYFSKTLEDDGWGVISAPLGNKGNIKKFYSEFLGNIIKDPENNISISENYKISQKNFIEQYNKVLALQDKINKPKLLEKEISKEELDNKIKKKQIILDKLNARNKEILGKIEISEIQAIERKILDLIESKENVNKEIYDLKSDVNNLDKKILKLRQKFCEMKKSITFFERLFKTNGFRSKEEQINVIKEEIEKSKEQIQEKNNQQTEKLKKLEKIDNDINSYNEFKLNCSKIEEIEQCITELVVFPEEKERTKKLLDNQAIKITNDNLVEKREAHLNNLWITAEYDIERMKLFYYALEFNKEFVLSSNCLNENLNILKNYWGFGKGNIKYDEEDMNRFVKSIYQSLFLVTPVISTAFASIHNMFKHAQCRNVFGTLIIDEAGQAQPKMALGALYRCNKAMIVGDPKQIEPIYDEDTKKLCEGIKKNTGISVLSSSESVQSYVDRMNMYGTNIESFEQNNKSWIGLPLVVHRRCESPMFDISNMISYSGTMLKETKTDTEYKGIYCNSRWIEVNGEEQEKNNHYVKEQAEKVVEMLRIADKKGNLNNVFVITPFKTVSSNLKNKMKSDPNPNLKKFNNIGTVHTFQGKEADEVIFVLGCDKKAKCAVMWVNSNIVNVAASRAKHRFYIIGAIDVWKNNKYILQAKACLDLNSFNKIIEVKNDGKMNGLEKNIKYERILKELPTNSNQLEEKYLANGIVREQDELYENTVSKIIPENMIAERALKEYGFSSIEDLEKFSEPTRKFIKNGLLIYSLLYYVFNQIGKDNFKEIDTSCCTIEFAKALESQARKTFVTPIKEELPNSKVAKKSALVAEKAEDKDFTLGSIPIILENNKKHNPEKVDTIFLKKSDAYQSQLIKCLKKCTRIRNDVAHSEFSSGNESIAFRKFAYAPKANGEFNELTKGLMVEMLQLQKMYQKH